MHIFSGIPLQMKRTQILAQLKIYLPFFLGGVGGGGVSLAIRGGDVSSHSLNPDSLYFRSISLRQTPKFLYICLLSNRPLSMINRGILGRISGNG